MVTLPPRQPVMTQSTINGNKRKVVVHERNTGMYLCTIHFDPTHPMHKRPPVHMHPRIMDQWIMDNCQNELRASGLSL